MRAGWLDNDAVALSLCCFLPPVVVARKRGFGLDFILAFELTMLGWLPGAMMAVFVQYADEQPRRRSALSSLDPPPPADPSSPGSPGRPTLPARRPLVVNAERDRWKERRRRRRPDLESSGEDGEEARLDGFRDGLDRPR